MEEEQENLCVLGLWCETIVTIVWKKVKSCCLVGLREMSRWSEGEGEGEEKWREKRETYKGGEVALQVLRESEGGGIRSFNVSLQQREIERESSWGVGGLGEIRF